MKSAPLKWHGGKSYLAPWIIEHFPPHTRYCEPYFGGGAVLFRKDPEGVAEFVNDIDEHLTNFWAVLQHPLSFPRFQRLCEATPLSMTEWKRASWSRQDISDDPVDSAAAFFIRYRQSRQGLGKDYCTPTKRLRRGMNENVSAWLSAVEGLPEAHERLRRVEIWNVDALEFIRKLDSPDTLFYCDPPYLHETRSGKGANGDYQHEMTVEQHTEMLCCLSEIRGKFVLSGYPSNLYSSFERRHRWRYVQREIDNKASGKRSKEKKTECLWMNF